MPRPKVRFAVGDDRGIFSSTWSAWTNPNSGAYLAMLPDRQKAIKISLHPGKCRMAFETAGVPRPAIASWVKRPTTSPEDTYDVVPLIIEFATEAKEPLPPPKKPTILIPPASTGLSTYLVTAFTR